MDHKYTNNNKSKVDMGLNKFNIFSNAKPI